MYVVYYITHILYISLGRLIIASFQVGFLENLSWASCGSASGGWLPNNEMRGENLLCAQSFGSRVNVGNEPHIWKLQ
jgi:hypothetical protein